jgi:hypothetical protein
MKIQIIFFSFLIVGCAVTPNDTPFNPPYYFSEGFQNNSVITFKDVSESSPIYAVIAYEEPDRCYGQRSLRLNEINTFKIPNNKEFSFGIFYTHFGSSTAKVCHPIFTFTPTGGEYEVVSQSDTSAYCSVVIYKKNANNQLQKVQSEQRIFNRPLLGNGPWCDKR